MITRRKTARASVHGPSRSVRRKSYRVVCTVCGKEMFIEVPPPVGKDLFCVDCFKK